MIPFQPSPCLWGKSAAEDEMVGWHQIQWTWTWANSQDGEGRGAWSLQPLGSQSGVRLSDWTTTLVVTWLFWMWTELPLYERQCIQGRPHRAVSESHLGRPAEQGQWLALHVSLPKSNIDDPVDLQTQMSKKASGRTCVKKVERKEIHWLLLILRTLWCSWRSSPTSWLFNSPATNLTRLMGGGSQLTNEPTVSLVHSRNALNDSCRCHYNSWRQGLHEKTLMALLMLWWVSDQPSWLRMLVSFGFCKHKKHKYSSSQ